MEPLKHHRKQNFYEKYVKRGLDILASLLFLLLFWWVLVIIAIMVRVKLGSPVFFKQPRPGIVGVDGREKIFTLYKFRTMTDERDREGNLLSDEKRLSPFGKWLRSTSLDELPEVINILIGDMSFIGPRPQLVRDMVFMDQNTRLRHTVKPGLSGLAQVEGRNAITWELKFEYDLKYIQYISFKQDFRILFKTVQKAFLKQNDKESKETDLADDYGDWLLLNDRVSQAEYAQLQKIAIDLLEEYNSRK